MTQLTTDSPPPVGSFMRLRAVVLLGGAVRQGHFGTRVGRPIFDLPLESGQSILDHWRRQIMTLRPLAGPVPARVMIDHQAPQPAAPFVDGTDELAPVHIERDPVDYRGTGGVLRDIAGVYADDDFLLVANAAQVLLEPLADLVAEMAEAGGDVSLVAHRDGSPIGLFLVRCGCLRNLPAEGFVDLKEQALPTIARTHAITVVQRRCRTGVPVRTLADYIDALRCHHQRLSGAPRSDDPFAEDWECAFSIIEKGAQVDPAARLHDSVVLRGGCVEANAVVVHSIVCSRAVVRRGGMAVDELVVPLAGGYR